MVMSFHFVDIARRSLSFLCKQAASSKQVVVKRRW